MFKLKKLKRLWARRAAVLNAPSGQLLSALLLRELLKSWDAAEQADDTRNPGHAKSPQEIDARRRAIDALCDGMLAALDETAGPCEREHLR